MYNALIDGFLEKSASKWKEMILGGGLSGASKDKLLKKYVDPERMIAGLNRGSDNMIKGLGVNVERNSFLDRAVTARKYKLPKAVLGMSYATSPDTKHITLAKGFADNHIPFFSNPFAIKYRSSRSMPNRYIDTVVKRHEVDEVRTGRKILGGRPMFGDQPGAPKVWNPNKHVRHFSPEVLARESEHAALAPGAVREQLTKVRKRTGEAAMLQDAGFGYGQKSLYGKQRREAVNKLFSNVGSSV